MQILYGAHWLIPWFVAAVGLYAIVKFARGYFDNFSLLLGSLLLIVLGLSLVPME